MEGMQETEKAKLLEEFQEWMVSKGSALKHWRVPYLNGSALEEGLSHLNMLSWWTV